MRGVATGTASDPWDEAEKEDAIGNTEEATIEEERSVFSPFIPRETPFPRLNLDQRITTLARRFEGKLERDDGTMRIKPQDVVNAKRARAMACSLLETSRWMNPTLQTIEVMLGATDDTHLLAAPVLQLRDALRRDGEDRMGRHRVP